MPTVTVHAGEKHKQQRIIVAVGTTLIIGNSGCSLVTPIRISLVPGDGGSMTLEQQVADGGEWWFITGFNDVTAIMSKELRTTFIEVPLNALRINALLSQGIVEIAQ